MELFSKRISEQLEKFGHRKSVASGKALSKHDTPARLSMPVVLSGSLRVTRRDDQGREIFLYYIRPGETCVMAFMSGLNQDKSEICAVVEEDAEVIMLPVTLAAEWVRTDPEWYNFVFKIFHTRFTELLDTIATVSFQNMEHRILDILNKKTILYHSNVLNITHQQLANELGSTREVISRSLKQLENQELIKLSRGKVTVLKAS